MQSNQVKNICFLHDICHYMKLNKEKFFKTEFGAELKNCIECWEMYLISNDRDSARLCQAQWEVYKLVLRQFYSVNYSFTRTDDHYGVVNGDDYSDWLFKVER